MIKKILFSLFICMAVFILPAAGISAAGTDVIENNESGIPDKDLYKAVLKQLKTWRHIKKSRKQFTKQEAERLDYLNIMNADIKTFQGIEYLKNIEILYIAASKIKTYEGIENLERLERLDIEGCGIKNLKQIEDMPHLKALKLNGNKLKNLNFLKKMVNVEDLEVTNNQLSNLKGIQNLKKLKYLEVSGNNLTSLKELRNQKLMLHLYAERNQLKNLKGIENLKNLEFLYVSENQLSSLKEVKNLRKLREIDAGRNRIKNLDGFKGLYELETLSLARNQLTGGLPQLKHKKKLHYLDVRDNCLTSVGGIQSSGIRELYVCRNQLTDLNPIANMKKLIAVDAAMNKITFLPYLKKSRNLSEFNIKYNFLMESEQDMKEKLPAELVYNGGGSEPNPFWLKEQLMFQNLDYRVLFTDPAGVEQIRGNTVKIAGKAFVKGARIKLCTMYIGDGSDEESNDPKECIYADTDESGRFVFDNTDLKTWVGKEVKVSLGTYNQRTGEYEYYEVMRFTVKE